MQARVASVNVGRPREIIVDGKLDGGRPGAYLRIVAEGEVGAGDAVQVVSRPDDAPMMGDVMRSKTKRSE